MNIPTSELYGATEDSVKLFHALASFLILRDFLFDINLDVPSDMDQIMADEMAMVNHFGQFVVYRTIHNRDTNKIDFNPSESWKEFAAHCEGY